MDSSPRESCQLQNGTFTFPVLIGIDSEFTAYQELDVALQKEQAAAKLPPKLYFKHFNPLRSVFSSIRYNCKYCSAHFTLRKLAADNFVVTRMFATHNHNSAEPKDPFEEEVYKMYLDISKNPHLKLYQITKQLMGEFNLSRDNCLRLIKRFEDLDKRGGFNAISEWAKQNNYQIRFQWKDEPQESYPGLMVLVSSKMQENYSRFGDTLRLDMEYELLQHVSSSNRRYRAGLFTVFDTNWRPLLAGVAFLSEQSTETLFDMFKLLFQIHRSVPQSIMTSDKTTTAAAITSLRESRLFEGVHLLNPWEQLNTIKEEILGNKKTKSLRETELMEAMMERNADEYYKKIRRLQDNPETSDVVRKLLERRQQLFYCEEELVFIGVRNSAESLANLVKDQIPSAVRFDQFLEVLSFLDSNLALKSQSQFDMIKQPVEKAMRDDRLKEVRLSYERHIVQRFIENYIAGLRDFLIVKDTNEEETREPEFVVRFIESSRCYRIREWVCECGELEKTGVPCPHLLLVASTTPQISYSALIARRWKKQRSEVEAEAQRIRLRKGPPMPSRRNAMKNKRKVGAR